MVAIKQHERLLRYAQYIENFLCGSNAAGALPPLFWSVVVI